MKTIEVFNPTKAEITSAIEKVKDLKIKDVDDEVGYLKVKEAKKVIGRYRIDISRFGKAQRKEARDYASEVIRQEKVLLNMIAPTENGLKEQLDAIDNEKKLEERKVLLPSRKKMLKEIGFEMSDDEILEMDEDSFAQHFSQLKNDYLFEKERQLKEREESLKREKEIEEAKKIAREEEIENAKLLRIEEKKRADEELKRVEQEKVNEIARLKQEQIDKEAREKEQERIEVLRKENEAKELVESERVKQLEIEANKKYQKFLEDNNYNEGTDITQKFNDEIFLYRFVNKFKK